MASTTDGYMTELSEYFMVVIASTDQSNAVEIGLSNVSFITIKDNNPGICTQCGDVVRLFSILCVSNECGLEEVLYESYVIVQKFAQSCDK